jgi:hypothetical protein
VGAGLGEGIVALAWITGRNSTLVHERSRPTASNGHDGTLQEGDHRSLWRRARGRTECRFLTDLALISIEPTSAQAATRVDSTVGLVTLRNERAISSQAGLDRPEPSPQASLCHREQSLDSFGQAFSDVPRPPCPAGGHYTVVLWPI